MSGEIKQRSHRNSQNKLINNKRISFPRARERSPCSGSPARGKDAENVSESAASSREDAV